jgi:hypothetical protein
MIQSEGARSEQGVSVMDRTEVREPLDSNSSRDSNDTIESPSSGASQDRIPSIQELLGQDLARLADLLPEETRYHLKRAGTEAGLALYHLWRRVEAEVRGSDKPKVRKRIDIE